MSGITLIVIVGETGGGKSQAAMELAAHFSGEIISADSWQVYREFDIGTAKPTQKEQALIPHHLIDIADPRKGFNAALFKDLAQEAIKDIEARGKLPILAGGTGLYIDSVLFDYGFLPTVSNEERTLRNQQDLSKLLAEADASGIDLTGIDTRNKRRVIRALETGGESPTSAEMRPHTIILGIQTSRESLKERITGRVDDMLVKGLEQEVKHLSQKYGWDVEPMKGIGYREWREYFEGSQDLDQTRERIISGTMNLAKKQRTWFKRNKRIRWQDSSEFVSLATKWLQTDYSE